MVRLIGIDAVAASGVVQEIQSARNGEGEINSFEMYAKDLNSS